MAVPPVVAAQLAKLSAEQVRELRSKAKRVGEAFADQFGLTGEKEYIGWKLLMLLAFELWENKLKGPAQAAYHIEVQLVGLIEQAYNFLGGAGSSLQNGLSTLEKAFQAEISTVEGWVAHL